MVSTPGFRQYSFVPDLVQLSNLGGVCIDVTNPNECFFFFFNKNHLNKQSQKSPTSSRILRKVQIYLNFAHLSPFPEAQSFISTKYAAHNLSKLPSERRKVNPARDSEKMTILANGRPFIPESIVT